MAKACTRLEQLGLSSTKITDKSLKALGCSTLKVLLLDNCQITPAGLLPTIEASPGLQKVKLKGGISHTYFNAFALHCPTLRGNVHFRLRPPPPNTKTHTHTELKLSEGYWIKDSYLLTLLRACKHLETLYLDNCLMLTDLSVSLIASYCPKMRSLSLNNVNIKEEATLEQIATCTNLEKLALARCFPLSELLLLRLLSTPTARSPSLSTLISFNISYTVVTDRACRRVLKKCPHIQRLDVSHTGSLSLSSFRPQLWLSNFIRC